jgi:hypothetical protein
LYGRFHSNQKECIQKGIEIIWNDPMQVLSLCASDSVQQERPVSPGPRCVSLKRGDPQMCVPTGHPIEFSKDKQRWELMDSCVDG